MIAQQILASLLASATATRRSGFLARSAAIESARGPLRLRAKRSTAVEPTTSNLRIYRLPCLVTAPSLALPPLEFCLGVSPSQAAKSRPDLNTLGSGTLAAIAEAVSGPTPGTRSSRRQVLLLALALAILR